VVVGMSTLTRLLECLKEGRGAARAMSEINDREFAALVHVAAAADQLVRLPLNTRLTDDEFDKLLDLASMRPRHEAAEMFLKRVSNTKTTMLQ
jgi:hypothetical protein